MHLCVATSNCCMIPESRGGSRAATIYKIERFVIIVNDWKQLTVITKPSVLDVVAALDPPLGKY